MWRLLDGLSTKYIEKHSTFDWENKNAIQFIQKNVNDAFQSLLSGNERISYILNTKKIIEIKFGLASPNFALSILIYHRAAEMPLKDFLDKISSNPKQNFDKYIENLMDKITLENLQDQGFINKHNYLARFLLNKSHSSSPLLLSVSANDFNSMREDDITNIHKAINKNLKIGKNKSVTVLEYSQHKTYFFFMSLLQDIAGDLTLNELLLRLKAPEDQLNSDSKKTKTTSTGWSTNDALLSAFIFVLISLVVWRLSKHTKTSNHKRRKNFPPNIGKNAQKKS